MPRRLKTAGKTIVNYRGRSSTLLRIPTPQNDQYVNCESFGQACEVEKAAFDPDVDELTTENAVAVATLPRKVAHLDVRKRRHGRVCYTEVKADDELDRPETQARLREIRTAIEATGGTLEEVSRSLAIAEPGRSNRSFLLRYLFWTPSAEQQRALRSLVLPKMSATRTEWLALLSELGLPASVLYWAIAQGLLVIDDCPLFPNGSISVRP